MLRSKQAEVNGGEGFLLLLFAFFFFSFLGVCILLIFNI